MRDWKKTVKKIDVLWASRCTVYNTKQHQNTDDLKIGIQREDGLYDTPSMNCPFGVLKVLRWPQMLSYSPGHSNPY